MIFDLCADQQMCTMYQTLFRAYGSLPRLYTAPVSKQFVTCKENNMNRNVHCVLCLSLHTAQCAQEMQQVL